MSLLQQVKDVISTLEDDEKKELYKYLGELIPKETASVTCRMEEDDDDNERVFEVTKEAPVKPEDAGDEQSDAPLIPAPYPQQHLTSTSTPPPQPQPQPQLHPQPQPKEEGFFIDRTAHRWSDVMPCCETRTTSSSKYYTFETAKNMSSEAMPRGETSSTSSDKYYTLDTAKNVVQQFHQTFINQRTTPQYIQSWEDPEFSGMSLSFGFTSVLVLQLDPEHPEHVRKFCGTGSNKKESEKNAALKACQFLEQEGLLDKMFNEGSSPKRPVQNSNGLTPENAAGYLMYCKNTFVVNDVERPMPRAAPQGGFVAETIIVTPKEGRNVFQTDRPRNRKQEARNEADYQAALWVRNKTGVSVPDGMAR